MDEQRGEHGDELGLDPVAVVRKRQPRALWAVLVAVAVAAGALVITSADDEGNQRPGLPVDLAGSSGAGRAEAAADSTMPAWVSYVPGDGLPGLGGEATAYRLDGDVDEGQVRELAGALGLDGEVQSDGPGSWWVAGVAGRLDVYAGGGAYWSYSAGEQDCATEDGSIGACCEPGVRCSTFDSTGVAIDGCAAATDDVAVDCAAIPTTTTVVDPRCGAGGDAPPDCATASCEPGVECVEPGDDPVAPADLTGEDDARAAALAVVAASGADVGGARVTVDADGGSRSWFVTVEPVVDGIPSGLVSLVEVSEDAVVTSGNGHVGQPEALGEYPLLDTRAVIARANAQSGRGIEPALGDPEATSSTTTGGDVETATTLPCKVQADGSEICEYDTGCGGAAPGTDGESPSTRACEPPTCPQAVPSEDIVVDAPESIDCTPPPPGVPPIPLPEPEPLDIVLVDAEASLLLLPATDGSVDAYLVPAYRFTAEDGSTVDLPAVADEALSGSTTTETTVPDTVGPQPPPVPEPQPCEVLEEADSSGTTHTIQTCPAPNEDPGALPPGEEPVIGVGYYVDIDAQCAGGTFELGPDVWITDDVAVAGWADPGERHEGGTFTLDSEDHGTFVGDATGNLVADFRVLGPAEDIFCTPAPRG